MKFALALAVTSLLTSAAFAGTLTIEGSITNATVLQPMTCASNTNPGDGITIVGGSPFCSSSELSIPGSGSLTFDLSSDITDFGINFLFAGGTYNSITTSLDGTQNGTLGSGSLSSGLNAFNNTAEFNSITLDLGPSYSVAIRGFELADNGSVTPEPATAGMIAPLLGGLLAFGIRAARRKRTA